MFSALQKLVERQLLKASAEGKLKGLEGEGAPLPDRTGQETVDQGLASGLRIMAEAGVVPEEFTLKKQLDDARTSFANTAAPHNHKEIMQQIADLEMRYNMAKDARKAFFR